MKKIILLITILSLTMVSCYIHDPYSDYCGSQIVDKSPEVHAGHWFKFRYNRTITGRVYVTEYDWSCYNVGDTIKCN